MDRGPDETNFEYGLECILDHAGRLIEQSSKAAGEVAVRRPTATADAPTPGAGQSGGALRAYCASSSGTW